MKESSRNLVRPCPGENSRNLREEIVGQQKVTEGRMRRAKDVDEREENGGRGGEVRMRMRKEEGRRILGGGGGNPEGRGRSWMLPRLSSPAVQVAPPSFICTFNSSRTSESCINNDIRDEIDQSKSELRRIEGLTFIQCGRKLGAS